MEVDNVYSTPVSNRSTTSLQNLADSDDEEEGYVNVEDGTSPNYLRLMATMSPPDGDGFSRSHSSGRRSPSPTSPPNYPPPLLPKKAQIYENSQEVVPSDSSMPNGAFRRVSTGSSSGTRLMPNVQSLPSMAPFERQQIYENSQELVSSTSPFIGGAFKRTYTDGMYQTSPQSPPISMSAMAEKRIYENTKEVAHTEDTEEDIYENDIPGMNQQAPWNS